MFVKAKHGYYFKTLMAKIACIFAMLNSEIYI
jgi:hypothetical protein